MSHIAITILDPERAIHGQPHESFVYSLIPALSDDPETIDELRHAMQRFISATDEPDPLAAWSPGRCEKPCDAGICILDLAARFIAFQSTCCSFMRSGQIILDDDSESSHWIPYHISSEWEVTDRLHGWRNRADELRRKRKATPRCDTRAVLYGKVGQFIVRECFAARGGSTESDGALTPPPGWQWRELPKRAAAGKRVLITDAIAEIHARWLMTPREDLRGQSPRDVLHAGRQEISRQVADRELQWNNFGECPRPLWRESLAYRYAGYGIHEIVVYYDLVRYLLHECWDLVVEARTAQPDLTEDMAIERLGMIQQEWLHAPNHEEFSGKSPAQLIENERLRLPMAVSGAEAMIDCDCPLCQMMADSGRPVFWHLDGSHMDDDFPFAVWETTREVWEAEHDDDDDGLEAEGESDARANRVASDVPEKLVMGDGAPRSASSPSVWQRSFVRSHPTELPTLTLFGLGCHVAELIEDLRTANSGLPEMDVSRQITVSVPGRAREPAADSTADDARFWIDRLNRDFANLRQALTGSNGSLVAPVVAKFTEHLLELAEARPALCAKCLDLDRQLFELIRRLTGQGEH